jgi:hypothetical protein
MTSTSPSSSAGAQQELRLPSDKGFMGIWQLKPRRVVDALKAKGTVTSACRCGREIIRCRAGSSVSGAAGAPESHYLALAGRVRAGARTTGRVRDQSRRPE